MPEVGDKAPDFAALDTDGNLLRLGDFADRTLVLYFYPKDNTPGCTAQACGFRDQHPEFERLEAAVVGVSRDSVKSHQNFTAKHQLPFPLLADEDETVCRAYDVLHQKNSFGRLIFGIVRTTYVIDGDGVIRAKFPKVKVKGHIDEVMAAVREIGEPS